MPEKVSAVSAQLRQEAHSATETIIQGSCSTNDELNESLSVFQMCGLQCPEFVANMAIVEKAKN